LFQQLKDVILAATRQRQSFAIAIGYSGKDYLVNTVDVPKVLSGLYAIAEGTPRCIKDQSVMDIVPGYRLIHRLELQDEIKAFRKAYPNLVTHSPFLADYSSCYYTVDSEGVVYSVDSVHGAEAISKSLQIFLATVLDCYIRGAYFLDADGYLDYDPEFEGQIGSELNPDYQYWSVTRDAAQTGEPGNASL